jgi:hypothetical protein
MNLSTDTPMKLAVLVEGALAVGVHEAQAVTDADGNPATLTTAGRVTLLRVIDESRKGFDRIDVFVLGDDDDDADGEVRLGSGDALFTLQERGAEAPVLDVHNRDVKAWLGPVLLALTTKISPDEAVGHA